MTFCVIPASLTLRSRLLNPRSHPLLRFSPSHRLGWSAVSCIVSESRGKRAKRSVKKHGAADRGDVRPSRESERAGSLTPDLHWADCSTSCSNRRLSDCLSASAALGGAAFRSSGESENVKWSAHEPGCIDLKYTHNRPEWMDCMS